jgi:hypothetical protein
MSIGKKSYGEAVNLLDKLLDTHWVEIKQAYLKAEKGINISLSIGFEEIGGRVHVAAGINFVAERVKNQLDSFVDELQEPLFSPAMKGLAKSIKKGEISITTNINGKATTIDKTGLHEGEQA